MRIGIDSGSVVCGVVGLRKWHYDLWSKTADNAFHLQLNALLKFACYFFEFCCSAF